MVWPNHLEAYVTREVLKNQFAGLTSDSSSASAAASSILV